jgi:hypothetical protein
MKTLKTTLLLVTIIFFSYNGYSQIYTPSGKIQGASGNNSVGIGIATPSSSNSVHVKRTATGTYSRAFAAYVTPQNTAPTGYYARVYNSEPQSYGRTYGFFAEVGNATSGWNYGVYSRLLGSNNGAAIMGVVPGKDVQNVGGMWAGYFRGNVYVEENLGIGVKNPTEKLTVDGKVKCEEIVVENVSADFVFNDDYKLRSLDEVEAFIKENGHLPDVAPASETSKGINVGEFNTLLLQKIEELTLYMIELKKENEELRASVHKN